MGIREAIDIHLRAHDFYSKELKTAQRAFRVAGAGIGKAIKVGAVAGAAALAGLSVATYKAITAANAQEDAEKKLTAALGFRSRALLDNASALQKQTKFGDEAIIEAQALIAAFVKDEEQVKRATRATLDLAAAKGMDLKSAADLVGKSLGSSTNALSRYGVEVKGAVGSTERLDSLTKNVADTFGGQAAAQAETFGGKITQLRNAYGDLWEQLGFVITKNTFFLKALNIGKTLFENLTARVKENRQWLMELVKSGVVLLVKGIGWGVEVMRFFHNGWLGLKLAGVGATVAISEGLRLVLEALNLLLSPLKLTFDALIKLGLTKFKTNPIAAAFDAGREAVKDFQESSRTALDEAVEQIAATNAAYDRTKGIIAGIVTELQNVKVAQAAVTEGADRTPKPLGLGKEPGPEDKASEKARAGAGSQLAALGAAPGTEAPGDEVSRIVLGYQAQLEALEQFNTRKLGLMAQAGATQAEIEAAYTRMAIDQAKKRRDFQIAATAQGFGAAANFMQNLTQLTGKEGGAAFKLMQGFAIGQAIMDTYAAANKAMASLPFPASVAAAAAVTVAGLARVAQIKATKPGATSGTTVGAGGVANPGFAGGSNTASPPPIRVDQRPTQTITINIHNPLSEQNWQKITEDNIVPAIRDAQDRNVFIMVEG